MKSGNGTAKWFRNDGSATDRGKKTHTHTLKRRLQHHNSVARRRLSHHFVLESVLNTAAMAKVAMEEGSVVNVVRGTVHKPQKKEADKTRDKHAPMEVETPKTNATPLGQRLAEAAK